MKKITITWFIITTFILQASAKQPAFLFSAPVNGNIQLLEVGQEHFCIASKVIYRIEKKLVQKIVCTDTCNEAAVYNNI